MLCALLFTTPLAWSQQRPRTWSPIFDKIQDPDVLQTLHSYEKRGWDVAFRAEGKSAEQLILEGGMEQRRLQAAIDRDQFLLARPSSHLFASATPAQCKSALKNIHDPFFPACDKQLRQDQLLAVMGMLDLLPEYAKVLPAPVYTGRYGKILGNEAVATVTVKVVAPAPVSAAGLQARRVSVADDKKVIEVAQGENVLVVLTSGTKRVPGFIVGPASGVLEAPMGRVHFPTDRLMVLKATHPGMATIRFMGPLQSNQYFCSECWSGYLEPGGPFFGVQGSWIVPAIDPSFSPYGGSATWIGLDGYGESPLIQVGTSQNYSNGFFGIGAGVSYDAWWQVLPQFESSQDLGSGFPVFPGDAMLASISPTPIGSAPAPNTNFSWQIVLTDITQKWTFTTNQGFSGPLDQAEWILEDPSDCAGPFGCWRQSFANYGQVMFDFNDRTATSLGPGWVPNWTSPSLSSIEQLSINQNNEIYSTPSNPDADADGFYVTYSQVSPNPGISPGPWIETTTLAPAVQNQPYTQTLSALEPPNPFDPNGPVWSWALNGALPHGLSLNASTGTISGTPTALGTSNFSVLATDTVTGAFSQNQALSITVSGTPMGVLQIDCGEVTPAVPGAALLPKIDGKAAACGASVMLTVGTHTVSATITGVGSPYRIFLGGTCDAKGKVVLSQGQVGSCAISAESIAIIENACPKGGQICCESSPTGCKKCITPPEKCP
jgi:hypothetical protein